MLFLQLLSLTYNVRLALELYTEVAVEAIADVYLNGGYIAIETPTGLNMTEFGAKFAVALLKKQNARLSSRFLVNGLPINLSAEESQAVERLKTRIANIVNIAGTNSGGIIDRLKSPVQSVVALAEPPEQEDHGVGSPDHFCSF